MTTTADPAAVSFSATLRERTETDHSEAEHSDLMTDLMGGTISRERMGALLAQHLLVYRALDAAEARLADDPVVGPFLQPGLSRVAALEDDLRELLGRDALDAIEALPATADYVARLDALGTWAGGFIAHHYTRYMGDLSGGQFIGRAIARAYPDWTIRFYTFDAIESPKAFKDRYRELLDAAPWSPEEQDRIIDEVKAAYALNMRMFADLES